MKNRGLILLLLMITGVTCAMATSATKETDRGFDELKHSFQKSEKFYNQLLDMASALEYRMFQAGDFISKADCKALETQIAKNYKHNPFHTTHQDGSFSFSLCGDEDEQMNYLLKETGRTQMGLEYETVAQVLNTKQSTGILRNVLISKDFKIVGSIDIEINLGTQEILASTVLNLDSVGNFYIRSFDSQADDTRTGIQGIETVDQVLLANGAFYLPLMRQRIKSNSDVAHSIGMTAYFRADTRDSTGFEVLPTFGRALYDYDGEFYTTPIDYTSWIRVFENDLEVCSFGNVTKGHNQTTYPINEKERIDCLLK